MFLAQIDQKYYANQCHSPAPQYKVGDMVWLDTRNLFTKRSSYKLENCHTGKYLVKKVISPYIIELDLFLDLSVYPMFHINLLKLAVTDLSHLSNVQPFGPLIKFEREIKYEIFAIVDSCHFGKAKKF